MLNVLLSCILALLIYIFLYIRSELYRLGDRQNQLLMHVARLHRGLLTSIMEVLHADAAAHEDLPTVVEEDEAVDSEKYNGPLVEVMADERTLS